MAVENENFILKEFLVGLVVIIFFLVIILFGIRKFTQGSFYKNIFTRSPKTENSKDVAYCSKNAILSGISQDKKLEFNRLLKRSGWQDKSYSYNLTYTSISKNSISYDLNADDSEFEKETVNLVCGENGVIETEPDRLLVASILNVNPEELSNFASYKTNSYSAELFNNAGKDGEAWDKTIEIKGILGKEEGNCFKLSAIGLTKSEKDGENYKTETIWEATPSAYMASTKKTDECDQYSGEYDNNAFVSVKEERWYSPGVGLIKRKITPQMISGQFFFLPNGYAPLEITDEVVSN